MKTATLKRVAFVDVQDIVLYIVQDDVHYAKRFSGIL